MVGPNRDGAVACTSSVIGGSMTSFKAILGLLLGAIVNFYWGESSLADPNGEAKRIVKGTPPGAATAGFTTLALNSDFTKQLSANWLGGCAIAGNGAPVNTSDAGAHNWWMNVWWSRTYQPCTVVQVSDPVFGGLTLDIPWTVDTKTNNIGTAIQSQRWSSTRTVGSSNDGVNFPNNAYYEITLRLSPVAPARWGSMFTWPVLAMTDGSQQGLEHDIIEEDSGNLGVADSALHNWAASGGGFLWEGVGTPGIPPGFEATQYHTFGLRTTSDGTTLVSCSYINNVFQSCTGAGIFTGNESKEREFLILQNFCDYWNYSAPCNGNTGPQHLYVRSVRVWSCSSWQTTECNRSVLNNAP
jgi:hypothetical protein